MKRKLFAILLALVLCVSASAPALAASVQTGACCNPASCCPCPNWCWYWYCWQLPSVPGQPAEPEQPAEPVQPAEPADDVQDYERQVVQLVNQERANYGLLPLTLDPTLCSYARIKSQDLHDGGYFDHNSPTYGSPFDMMRQFGITYAYAGENIAMGYFTPAAVVDAWMHSSGHRANILSPNFTRLGVGYVADGGYWTQWFIG